MTNPALALRLARRRLLSTLRAHDATSAIDMAARKPALIGAGPWPAWLDRDEVEDAAQALAELRALRKASHTAWAALGQAGLQEAARAVLDRTRTVLAWRMGDTSPDAHLFHGVVSSLLAGARPVKATEDSWDTLGVEITLAPHDTLDTILDLPIDYHGRQDTVGDILRDLQEGAALYTLHQELLLQTGPAIPPDARSPVFAHLLAWARWQLTQDLTLAPRWLDALCTRTIRAINTTYGEAVVTTYVAAKMTAVDKVMRAIGTIGGMRHVLVYGDDTLTAGFTINADGRYLGDANDTPWAQTALQSILGHVLAQGGALTVERLGSVRIQGRAVRETFAARLEEGAASWFDAAACRAVYTQDFATGAAMPHEPDRLYRDATHLE